MIEKRPDFKLIKTFPKCEPIVSMITFREKVYVATSLRLYVLNDDKLEPLEMYMQDD